MLILSNEQVRKAEAAANSKGLSYAQMMENAGKGCADFILASFPHADFITVLCGKGKNGGDGYVIARHLRNAGKTVTVASLFDCASDELSEHNKSLLPLSTPHLVWQKHSEKIAECINRSQIVIEAVFGIGFKGCLPSHVKAAFSLANASEAIKIAIDMPGGLTCDNPPDDSIFKADYTLSMLCLKKEQVFAPYSRYCGQVSVIPIGFDVESDTQPCSFTLTDAKQLLPKRPFNSNKGSLGNALIIAGSATMPGAAVLCTKGALNSGVGLTRLAFPCECAFSVMTKLNECVFLPLPKSINGHFSPKAAEAIKEALKNCTSVAIGCGLGNTAYSYELLSTVIKNCTSPLIIDADGINILASHKDLLKEAKCPVLLTPHPGEMARLTGSSVQYINKNRIESALNFAVKNRVYLLLKGVNTVVCSPEGRVFINPTGSTGLSRGGSGDLLTGIAVSLSAQGLSPFDVLCMAAYIHGLAGDIAQEKFTPYCSSVERIARCLPHAFLKISESK